MHTIIQSATQFVPQQIESVWNSAEAALYLRIHPRTLTRMAKQGEIPAIHLGRLWRFRKKDLDSWLERRLISTPSSSLSASSQKGERE